MSYIRLSDIELPVARTRGSYLGQVAVATGGGGGGGAVYATQARQATGYTMPGHAPPASTPMTYTPPIATSTPRPTPTSTTTGGGGSTTGGGITTSGGGGTPGSPPPGGAIIGRSWETTRITVEPGYTNVNARPAYVEGELDPYDMFASSSVDEGPPEEEGREFVDTTGGQQNIPTGPQKVYMIEDDPELNAGLGDVTSVPASSDDERWTFAVSLAAGLLGGLVGSAIVARLMKR